MENSSTVSTASPESSPSSSGNQLILTKRKRSLPGNPDPDAEIVALSPKSLMTKNRFVCEICKKGFQREQNLQLHRRGHNLPWKLRQRTGNEIQKRVYICPEPSCPHHDPSRALGDLTGIKKHYGRKHGEKNWKCEKCAKKYAVPSDLKAHMKSCGTKEYTCDCGTIFSRRDSYVTHRAFCNALAEESVKTKQQRIGSCGGDLDAGVASPPPLTPSSVVSPGPSIQSSEGPDNSFGFTAASSASVFASIFASSEPQQPKMLLPASSSMPVDLASLFPKQENGDFQYVQAAHPPPAAMSATALLQKAAQVGSTTSSQSLLHGFGLEMSPASSPGSMGNVKLESDPMQDYLGLGLGSFGLLGSSSSLFGNKPTTLDLFGLGIGAGPGDASSTGLSALLSSFQLPGSLPSAASYGGGGTSWEDAPDGKNHG